MNRRTASDPETQRAPEFFSSEVTRARRFYLELNPGGNQRLAVVCGGVEQCLPDYAIHRTTFPFHSIEYVSRGRGELRLKGRRHVLQPGRLFSYGPGIPHHITGDPKDPLVKYFVDFRGRGAPSLLESCGLGSGRVSQVHPPNALQGLFDELIETGLRVVPGRRELCIKLLECLVLKTANTRMPLRRSESPSFATYQHCRHYMQEHALRLRTLGQVAKECHIDNAYLCRLFRRYDHQSPYQFLLRLKMNLAAERLQQPGSLVKRVAAEAGFGDAFHFSRVFKNVFGVSPDAFRKMR
jgi:AraC-like DNA-binding protein/quercetin dioxygenase-like cupin family protein